MNFKLLTQALPTVVLLSASLTGWGQTANRAASEDCELLLKTPQTLTLLERYKVEDGLRNRLFDNCFISQSDDVNVIIQAARVRPLSLMEKYKLLSENIKAPALHWTNR